jgi:hypothetical protein
MNLPEEPEPRNPAHANEPPKEGETEEHRDWRAFRWALFMGGFDDDVEAIHAAFHKFRDSS